jgi:hypothetical protein
MESDMRRYFRTERVSQYARSDPQDGYVRAFIQVVEDSFSQYSCTKTTVETFLGIFGFI